MNSGDSCNVVYLDLAISSGLVLLANSGNGLGSACQIARSHFVQFSSSCSEALPVLSGVPQGSILGSFIHNVRT